MPGVTERTLAVLEYLATQMEGTPLAHISDELDIPRSACHRLLVDLKQCGYVRQLREHGDYVLTTKLVGLGLGFLATSGIVDIAQTILDRLAEKSGELVRLAIVDGDRITWVAKAQGALKGLRYDPDMGMDTVLSCSATGHAWMMTMSDERALELVSRQGFGQPKQYGPKAPTTVHGLLEFVACREEARLCDDQPGLRAGHDRDGRARAAARLSGDGRDQHCRTARAGSTRNAWKVSDRRFSRRHWNWPPRASRRRCSMAAASGVTVISLETRDEFAANTVSAGCDLCTRSLSHCLRDH